MKRKDSGSLKDDKARSPLMACHSPRAAAKPLSPATEKETLTDSTKTRGFTSPRAPGLGAAPAGKAL